MAKKKTVEAAGSACERLDALFAFMATKTDALVREILSGKPSTCGEGRAIVQTTPEMRGAIVREITARLEAGDFREPTEPKSSSPTRKDLEDLLVSILEYSRKSGTIVDAEPAVAAAADHVARIVGPPLNSSLIYHIQYEIRMLAEKGELSDHTREAVGRMAAMVRDRLEVGEVWPRYSRYKRERQFWLENLEIAQTCGVRYLLEPGEAWSDLALAEIEGMPAGPVQTAWVDLLRLGREFRTAKPTEK
jgi:hypothetical protein